MFQGGMERARIQSLCPVPFAQPPPTIVFSLPLPSPVSVMTTSDTIRDAAVEFSTLLGILEPSRQDAGVWVPWSNTVKALKLVSRFLSPSADSRRPDLGCILRSTGSTIRTRSSRLGSRCVWLAVSR